MVCRISSILDTSIGFFSVLSERSAIDVYAVTYRKGMFDEVFTQHTVYSTIFVRHDRVRWTILRVL